MPEPPLKPPTPSRPPEGSWLSILLVLMLLGTTLAILSFLTLGAMVGAIVLALMVLPGVVLFHYLLWGWWLGKMIEQDADAEEGD